jgi:hypothetical protein
MKRVAEWMGEDPYAPAFCLAENGLAGEVYSTSAGSFRNESLRIVIPGVANKLHRCSGPSEVRPPAACAG